MSTLDFEQSGRAIRSGRYGQIRLVLGQLNDLCNLHDLYNLNDLGDDLSNLENLRNLDDLGYTI